MEIWNLNLNLTLWWQHFHAKKCGCISTFPPLWRLAVASHALYLTWWNWDSTYLHEIFRYYTTIISILGAFPKMRKRASGGAVHWGATRRKVSGSFPGSVLRNFQVINSICPHSVVLGSTHKYTWVPRNFLGRKVQPTRRADNSAVLFLTNVKIWLEAQQSICPTSLHDLLR